MEDERGPIELRPLGTAEEVRRQGASVAEAEVLIGQLQAMGKSPDGAASMLVMALAVLALDQGTEADLERMLDTMPGALRQMVDFVRVARVTEEAQG